MGRPCAPRMRLCTTASSFDGHLRAALRWSLHPPASAASAAASAAAARGHHACLQHAGALSATAAAGAAGDAAPSSSPRRVAVVGGGFAGLAVSWHLLEAARAAGQPLQLQLFDAYGLGAGGSGAAAGLLHPYTPRGKLLWRGLEAFEAALELLQAAEAAAVASPAAEGIRRPFVRRTGMLRPSRSAKQAADITRFLPANPAAAAATQAEAVAAAAELAGLVPGLQPELLLPPDPPAAAAPAAAGGAAVQRKRQGQQQQRQQQTAAAPALGLMVHAGVTIHPASYLRALWLACEAAAAAAGSGSSATLRLDSAVPSLARLQAEQGPFEAVVVAAGAAVDSIAELAGRLPLDLCHGHSLDVRPGSSSSSSSGSSGGASYPAGAPSLLGSPYIAAHGADSLVVGATKRFGLTPAEAYAQLSHPVETDPEQAAAAAAALLPPAAQLWPPLAGWEVAAVRAGVRALPVRGADGSIPYAGRVEVAGRWGAGADLPSDSEPEPAEAAGAPAAQRRPAVWVVGGLGARGLVYHAWLGRQLAAAVLHGSEAGLPAELLRWRQPAA